MKRICQKCNVISHDLNLWCQEKDCPAEDATEIFDNGEWFGPMEIVQPIAINRSAIIYQARRGEELVLLKVANVGCEQKLKSEAKAFLELAKVGQHPCLPVLLAAHPNGDLAQHPYGWTVINGRVKFYMVFAYAEGALLSNLLLKNPQPWYQHAAWIVLSIADAVLYLHKANKLHLCLKPDMVLVRYDKQGYPRPLLLDLGVSDPGPAIPAFWDESYNLPAYTAPEILNGRGPVSAATDVYGLGLLLYEMLAGHPAFEYHLKREKLVIHHVQQGKHAPSGRIDLTHIPDVVEKAIQMEPGLRYSDVGALFAALSPVLPKLPAEQKPKKMNWRVLFIILGTLLAISLLLGLAIAMVPV
ncbi:MAG: protein kinase [Anaerolineae bacterium]|nr:protein kinase [Anaerolineae bacterium]